MIRISDELSIHDSEVTFEFIRASGPGGQNVNKVATAVQLTFDAAGSPSLEEDVKKRLRRLAGKRMSSDGILTITARRHRTQHQNREDALARFVTLVRKALEKPKPRKKTGPTKASRERRLEDKRRRSRLKRDRSPPAEGES